MPPEDRSPAPRRRSRRARAGRSRSQVRNPIHGRVRPAILQKEMNLSDRAIVDITADFALIGAGDRRLGLQVGNAVDESLRSQNGLLVAVRGVPVGKLMFTKISPRSTGGIYSKPTIPSGISSMRARDCRMRSRSPPRGAEAPRERACVYQRRMRSNTTEPVDDRHGFHPSRAPIVRQAPASPQTKRRAR